MKRGAVLVTGASGGIGAATACALAGRGFEVFGSYRDPLDHRRLLAAGVRPVAFDVTDPDAIATARDDIMAWLGGRGLIGLVNNAGVAAAGPVELVEMREFETAMQVNYFGLLRVTRAFLPLVRQGRGRIVMMSSLSGRVAMPLLAPYAASKFALEGLSDSLRRELAPQGVAVVLIEPGPVATPIWDLADAGDSEEYAGTPYARSARRLRTAARSARRSGLAPERVAAAVVNALVRERPPPRIVVASAAGRWKARIVRWLPTRVADRLIVRSRG